MNQVECVAVWNHKPVYVSVPNSLFYQDLEHRSSPDYEEGEEYENRKNHNERVSEQLSEKVAAFEDLNGQLIMHEVELHELTNLVPEGTEVPKRSCPRKHYCIRVEQHLFPHNNKCSTCDAYEARKQATKECKLLPFYIVAYGIDRAYGGPEEGGWWYDRRRILEVRKVYTWEKGLEMARKLKEEYPTCKRGRGSVLGGEDRYIKVCYTEAEFPSEGPNGKPRYE